MANSTELATAGDGSAPITINGQYAKSCAKPDYPLESIENREAGLVVVKFLLAADGSIVDRRIERSSGVSRLDEASKRALDLCKFSAEMASPSTEGSWKRIEYLWELGNFKPEFIASNCVRPDYPSMSAREAESGLVRVAILVNEQGDVIDSHIERTSGYRRLDEATQKALTTCKVAPALERGRAVPAWSRVEYLWIIEGIRKKAQVSFEFEAEPPKAPTKKPDWLRLLDMTYTKLPQWEREAFAAMFERTHPKDEPPFPAEGLGALYRPILEAQRRLRADGLLSLFLIVNAEGDVTQVDVFDAPLKTMKDFAVQLAILTKFKPGTCAGIACERGFPLRMRLESN